MFITDKRTHKESAALVHFEDPNLYTIHSEVIDNKKVVDNYTSKLGFQVVPCLIKRIILFI